MKTNANRVTRACVLGLLTLTGLQRPGVANPEFDRLSQQESFEVGQWRGEALNGNRTHIPQMIAGLHSHHTQYIYTALYSLAHLGATEALPDIGELLTRYEAPGYINSYARLCIARIQAEVEMPTDAAANTASRRLTPMLQASAQERGMAKVERVFALAATTPKEVGVAMYTYVQRKTQQLQEGRPQRVEKPQEVAALREVADVLYHEHTPEAQARKALPDLDFAVDFPSELKIKLAGLSRAERIAWLVNDLSQRKIGKDDDDYEIQLAADEGVDASNAAATKLKEMDGQRSKYAPAGFRSLLYVLDGVGDKAQLPLVRHFVEDKDQRISNTAGGRGGVSQGHGVQFMAGY